MPFPYIIGVIGVIGIEPRELPPYVNDWEMFISSGRAFHAPDRGGEGVESYSPYGRIISGFVRVGEAGRVG